MDQNRQERYELANACYDGDIDVVQRMIDQGAFFQVDGDSPADLCRSPVGQSIQAGHLEIVRLLLDRGLVLDGQVGQNALVVACRYRNTDIVRLLLDHAPAASRSSWGWTALMVAAGAGRVEAIRLLLDRGADVQAVDPEDHFTALHRAANNLRREAYQTLVERGANEHAPSLPLVDADPERGAISPRQLLDLRINERADHEVNANNQ